MLSLDQVIEHLTSNQQSVDSNFTKIAFAVRIIPWQGQLTPKCVIMKLEAVYKHLLQVSMLCRAF